jgi:hypothetical protein
MPRTKFIRVIPVSLFFFLSLFETISAQQVKKEFLPKYPVKSAVIQYNLKSDVGNDTASHPLFRETFDAYGSVVLKERIDEFTVQLMGELYQKIYRDGYVFSLNDPKGCVTKHKIKDLDYMEDFDGGFIKLVQDLIHGKITKSNDKSFQSFTKTGTITFLGLTCATYEYSLFNFALSSKDKYEFIVYHDICLSSKRYVGGNLLSTINATSFQENVSMPTSVFDLPISFRMIDGDKLDVTYNQATSGFTTIIVNYKTKRDYYQTKAEGKKTLYSKEHGKKSVWEWEETISEYGLPPESKHYKKIRDEECDFLVNYISKTVSRNDLVKGNYNFKPIAELNYLFDNKLYDTSVKELGKANFLGKNCTIFEIKTGIEKLEVHEWQGVFLKVKQFTCTDGPDCNQYILIGEETATNIQENVPISDSLFEYPEDFSRN